MIINSSTLEIVLITRASSGFRCARVSESRALAPWCTKNQAGERSLGLGKISRKIGILYIPLAQAGKQASSDDQRVGEV